MGRGLKVQKREYQEVYIGVVGHRNRRDDDSNRIRKGKVPNRYMMPVMASSLSNLNSFYLETSGTCHIYARLHLSSKSDYSKIFPDGRTLSLVNFPLM